MNTLHQALINNNPELLKRYIDLGYNYNLRNKNSDTLLHLAAACNAVICAEILIGKGMDLYAMNNYGHIPAFAAIQKDHAEIIKLFIIKGLDIEYRSENGFGLLHIAAINNAVNCAWLLISKGLAVNAKSHSGKDSITLIENSSWTDLRYLLLLNGAEYNKTYHHNHQLPSSQ